MAIKKNVDKKVQVKKTQVKKTQNKKIQLKKTQVDKTSNTSDKEISSVKMKHFPFVFAIVVVAVIAIAVAFLSTRSKQNVIVPIGSIDELKTKLNITMVEPKDAKNLSYGIQNGDIARVSYSKEVSDGYTMDFLLKSSSATENLVEYENNFGTIAILMTVICNDGSDIEVTSYVASDVPTIMKSEWYDNDRYYAMTTENLTTREDFLQEVNRVIIDNHIEF